MANLGERLYKLVEAEQGRAYISDSVSTLDDAQALAVAEAALVHARAVVKKLAAFVRAHQDKGK